MNAIDNPSRRTFLKAGAALGAGLTLGFYLPAGRAAQQTAATATAFAPNAFLRIAPDNTITVLVKHLEMGQGVYTGLPMLVAEELEAPWERIQVEVRARRRQALRQPGLGWNRARDRRQHQSDQFLGSVAPGGRGGARDVDRRRRRPVAGGTGRAQG